MQSPLDAERQALLAIRKLRAKVDALQRARTEPIAIVGMSCRFPGGADDPDALWTLLREGRDAVGPIPVERFDVEELFETERQTPGKTSTRWAGLVDGIDLFDEAFFGMTAGEAAHTDPQQRLFLEGTWRALEHAGIAPSSLRNSATGVFVGAGSDEYAQLGRSILELDEIGPYNLQGTVTSVISGRVSHAFGLQGPSMTIDTACSSALVAIDRACRSLREGESTLAIAGGVNVLALADPLVAGSQVGMFASDGRCKSFAAGADGYVRSEGCGVVVLKRLSQAQADGDRIVAVILGSGVNHDGPSSGLTVPNGQAQQALMRAVLASAAIDPRAVGYVEAQGTGSALGDAIEAEALGVVYGAHRPDRPLMIGSVKTNLGHAEAAGGVAGLLKVILALMHGEIPAQLHFDVPSDQVRWNAFDMQVVTDRRRWAPIDGRRIAGVNAFGFSGTNAHLLVAEAPVAPPAVGSERPVEVLALSARTEPALRTLAEAYVQRLASATDWADVCHTTNTGRAAFAHRLTARGDGEALAGGLNAYLAGVPDPRAVASVAPTAPPKIAFVFTGQGAQYVGMGRQLAASSPLVSDVFDAADALLGDALPVPLGDVVRGTHADAAALLNQTLYTQPALYVLEYALAAFWRSLGVEPFALIGHSLGEYVAAAVAGVFGFEDGLTLVADRAKMMSEVRADGAMVVVTAPAEQVMPLLDGYHDRVSVAAVNAPNQVTLSGERAAIEALTATCASNGWRTVALPVSQAFHSPLLDQMAAAFETRAAQLAYAAPDRPLISNVTGAVTDRFDAAYWRAHTRQSVRFADGVRALEGLGCDVLLEIGPRPTLLPLAQQTLGTGRRRFLATLSGAGQDWPALASTVQQLVAAGAAIDWDAWDRGFARRIVDVPVHPFERTRHWLTPSPPRSSNGRLSRGPGPLLGERIASPLPQAQFQAELPSAATRWLTEHRIGGVPMVPATGIIEMMLAAGAAQDPPLRVLGDLVIVAPLELSDDRARLVQTVVDPSSDERANVSVFAQTDEDSRDIRFALCAQGWLERADECVRPQPRDLTAIRARCAQHVDAPEHYARVRALDAELGPAFRGVAQLWIGEREALGEIVTTDAAGAGERPHPALVDACVQVAGALFGAGGATFLPFALERLDTFAAGWPRTVFAHVQTLDTDARAPRCDIAVCDATGAVLALLRAMTFARAVPAPRSGTLVELRPAASGLIDDVAFEVRERRAPAPDEIEIAVRATGLNFRDALNAMGMLPGYAQTIGGECAGVVARAGAAAGFAPGDAVMAFAPGQSGSFVTVRAADAVPKPAGLSFEQAAALPAVSMTAIYALERVARLQAGESVLIHAAAGGLGLAALHVARARGATVYATAGSEEKRAFVRALGAAHVMDSRSLGFAEQVLARTGGRGVDVVLNALSGAFIAEGFAALALGGRFVEVGKRGVLSADEARALRPDVAYTVFDLGEQAQRDPQLVPKLLAQTVRMIERHEFPPLPVTAYAFADARTALSDLAHARRIGKIVVTHGAQATPGRGERGGAAASATLATELNAADAPARRRLLLEHLRRQAALVLGLDAAITIDELRPLHELGLDSLKSVELRNVLAKVLQLRLSPTMAFDYPSLGQLTDHLLGRMFGAPVPVAAPSETDAIVALSETEAEALLLLELQGANG